MIELAIQNNIELFCLPPHTTHKLQPLDVGVFGPLQKAWVRQCDDYLGKTGEGMQKRHVVREYMQAREKSFMENTILQAWKKCGIRELEGIKVFTEADFAPSLNTSTRGAVPDSFPNEFPSDFEPWPGTEEPDEQEDIAEGGEQSYREFARNWENGEGGKDNDGKEEQDDDNSGNREESTDDERDASMDEDEGEGEGDNNNQEMEDEAAQEDIEGESGGEGWSGMVVDSENDSDSDSEQGTPADDFLNEDDQSETRAACDLSATGTPSTSTLTPSIRPQFYHSRQSSASTPLPFPQRSRDSEMSKRLDELLRPLPSSATRAEVLKQNILLQAELHVVRAERNRAQTHSLFLRHELDETKAKANAKSKNKKRRGDDIKLGELVTGVDASERRKVRRWEFDAKEKKKTEIQTQKDAKEAADRTRRTQIQRDPNHAFSGSLNSKNKTELSDIFIALGILVDSKTKKADMVQRLHDHFNNPSHVQDHESSRFSGLFTTSHCPRQTARRPEDENVNENDPPAAVAPAHLPRPLTLMYQPIAGPSHQPQMSDYRYHPYPPHPHWQQFPPHS